MIQSANGIPMPSQTSTFLQRYQSGQWSSNQSHPSSLTGHQERRNLNFSICVINVSRCSIAGDTSNLSFASCHVSHFILYAKFTLTWSTWEKVPRHATSQTDSRRKESYLYLIIPMTMCKRKLRFAHTLQACINCRVVTRTLHSFE